jgi:alpha-tubulin suppressor-like RCC1 family protein
MKNPTATSTASSPRLQDAGVLGNRALYLFALALTCGACESTTQPEDPPEDQQPTITIAQPSDGVAFESGTTVTFSAAASDPEDGNLGSAIVWQSSQDGALGSGATIEAVLSAGAHTIMASVEDAAGHTASATIAITVDEGEAPGAPIVWSQVAVGAFFSCGITVGGDAYCWGAGGQLGNGSDFATTLPTLVVGGHQWAQLSAGWSHACGVTQSGDAYCWGDGSQGRLGNGSEDDQSQPIPVSIDKKFTQVSADFGHTCGVTNDEEIYCWGWNVLGLIGDGTEGGEHSTPTRVVGDHRWKQVDAGATHTCAVTTSDKVWCWGANDEGQLGVDERVRSSSVPIAATAAGPVGINVSAGDLHTCGLSSAGAIYCWGHSEYGEAGDPGSDPKLIGGSHNWAQVATSFDASCGVTIEKEAYCWGRGGLLGDGTTVESSAPVRVSGDHEWKQVATSVQHSCGVTTGGRAYCWGAGWYGELGNGQSGLSNHALAPVPVEDPEG